MKFTNKIRKMLGMTYTGYKGGNRGPNKKKVEQVKDILSAYDIMDIMNNQSAGVNGPSEPEGQNRE